MWGECDPGRAGTKAGGKERKGDEDDSDDDDVDDAVGPHDMIRHTAGIIV